MAKNSEPRAPMSSGRFILIWFTAMVALTIVSLGAVATAALAYRHDHPAAAAAPAAPAAGTRTTTCPASAGLATGVTDKGSLYVGSPDVVISAGDSFFDPTCAVGVPKGKVSVTFTNNGQALHNVTIPELGIDKDIAPGESVAIKVDLSGPSVGYYCKYHRTSGMAGSLGS